MAKKTEPKYRDLGEKLRELREDRRGTQDELAQALKLHVNTIASFERGQHRPLPEFLIQFRNLLELDKDEWNELCEIYFLMIEHDVAPKSVEMQKHVCLVLNEDLDRIERLDCLKEFYQHQQSVPATDQINRRLLNRICAFASLRPIPLITGIDAEQSSGPAPWSSADQRAARLLERSLETLAIRREFLNERDDPTPEPDESSMIVIGGPGVSELSRKVNQTLSTESWFSGFYFQNEDIKNQWGWAVRHRTLPEVSITMADISDMANLPEDGRPHYRQLQDGQNPNQDVGILFAGPHPNNLKRWLVWAAGLRGMGTFAAARALHEPPIVEFIGRELLLRRHYISALVRYCFEDLDQKRLQGVICSVCLTTGLVPER